MTRTILGLAALALALTLASCKTAEERAREHYENGLALVEAGEDQKARVEFISALKLQNNLNDARMAVAAVFSRAGEYENALGNYMRAIEYEPENVEARRKAAELLMVANANDDAMEQVDAALAVAPDDIDLRGKKAVLLYRTDNQIEAVKLAEAVLAESPGQINANVVLSTQAFENGDAKAALGHIDAALAEHPDALALNVIRVSILESTGDDAAVLAQLRDMRERFPDNDTVVQAVVAHLLKTGDTDGAEAELTARQQRSPDDANTAMDLVQFLREARGDDIARARLAELAGAPGSAPDLTRALASFDFARGDSDAAVATLRQQITELKNASEVVRSRVMLAAMLAETGAAADSATIVEDVIASDPKNVDALKMRADTRINADNMAGAIEDLRVALDENPRDADAMLLLARAYARSGNDALAQEQLALAVSVSRNAPRASLEYANFLGRNGKTEVAADVLEEAASANPGNIPILVALGRARLSLEDWVGANQVATQLSATGDAEAVRVADGIRAAGLVAEQNVGAAVAALERAGTASGQKPLDPAALAAIVETLLRAGQVDGASQRIDDFLTGNPDNAQALLLKANVQARTGAADAAEATLRSLISAQPTLEAPYLSLSALLRSRGDAAGANAAIEAGLAAAETTEALRFQRAIALEAGGNLGGAIAIYEELYATNPNSDVLANNLASLLSQSNTDADSLERANVLSQRLRSSKNPAFQDTWGWVQHLRGENEAALAPLLSAVQGLPQQPVVRLHLGLVQAALNSNDDARVTLTEAQALAEAAGDTVTAAQAAAALSSLEAAPASK